MDEKRKRKVKNKERERKTDVERENCVGFYLYTSH
jgi:hypothetical protein